MTRSVIHVYEHAESVDLHGAILAVIDAAYLVGISTSG